MRTRKFTRGFVVAGASAGLLVVVAQGCASSGAPAKPGFDDAGDDARTRADVGGMEVGSLGDGNVPDASFGPDSGCATADIRAELAPAAMLVVLDGSGTMAANNKYAFAQQAIVSAIDEDAFDSASLGLLIYPTGNLTGPSCVLGLPVTCAVPGLAQVPLQPAGMSKSSASTGVRHDIYQQLVNSSPNTTGVGDGNPSYDAIQVGISLLQAWPQKGKRILFFITDGGASCTSLSSPPRPGYTDANGCSDWEYPASIVSLVQKANNDANAPVNTIFVGVPGADTDGSNTAMDPPYHVRLALSAEAWAGSPQTCDPSCDGKTFTQSGGDPTVPCHFDMTQNYSAMALAAAIDKIRGSLLGCVFDLPQPDGGMIDPSKVNVEYSTDGGMTYTDLFRRKSISDPCSTGNGCWDYNTSGQVVLIGPACSAVEMSPNADVQIVVGCATQVQ
ncbi:MAG TPA: hypothetical protein VMI75_06790 [Polyangiaceae bacterium]|nr:hypothetical protein [Polyangiaceae bacterium]